MQEEILSQRSGTSNAARFAPLIKKGTESESEYKTVGSHRKNKTELSNYYNGSNKSRGLMQNAFGGPLGKTAYKEKMYLKQLNEKNENPRFAASKAGSIIGGLISGMHTSDGNNGEANSEDEAAIEAAQEVQGQLQEAELVDEEDPELPEDEDDGITFMGDNESAFFSYLKNTSAKRGHEDSYTVATTAIEAIGSVYSGKTSALSQKYNTLIGKLN